MITYSGMTDFGRRRLLNEDAIHTEDGRTRVLVVRGGSAHAVPVEVGVVSGQAAEVVRGVAEGDSVLVGESARTIAPGMPVRVAALEMQP